MSGVFTAVFILTFTCYGPGCGFVDRAEQRAELPTQQACTFLRDVTMSRSTADAVISSDCHAELREVPVDLTRTIFGAPTRALP